MSSVPNHPTLSPTGMSPQWHYAFAKSTYQESACVQDKSQRDARDAVVITHLKHAADMGFGPAIFRLAEMYFHQKPTPNYPLAIQYFKEASQLDVIGAWYYLAHFYAGGWGVKQNHVIAVGYYQHAADRGYAAAECNLAYHFEEGLGVKKDLFQAAHYYKKAADHGVLEAKQRVADPSPPEPCFFI